MRPEIQMEQAPVAEQVVTATNTVIDAKKVNLGGVHHDTHMQNLVDLLANTPGAVDVFVQQQSKK